MFQNYVVRHDPVSNINVITSGSAIVLPATNFAAVPAVSTAFLRNVNNLFTFPVSNGSATVYNGVMFPVRMDPINTQTEVAFSCSFNASLTVDAGNASDLIPILVGFEQSSSSLSQVSPSSFKFAYPIPCELVMSGVVSTVSADFVCSVPANPVTSSNFYFVAVLFLAKWQAGKFTGACSMREVLTENAVFQPLK